MTPDDERLMRYADDALDPAGRADVEALLAVDPQARATVERYRAQSSALRAAFDPILEAPVPERLLRAAGAAPQAKVLPFRPRLSRRTLELALAAAAALVIGIGVGGGLSGPSDPFVARGALAAALDEADSGEAQRGVRIAMTVASESGGHCRVFETPREIGVACSDSGAWRVVALADAPEQTAGDYGLAGGAMPDAILAAIDQRRAGDPLGEEEERAARARGWR